jgi:hypothetical protein
MPRFNLFIVGLPSAFSIAQIMYGQIIRRLMANELKKM